MHLPNITRACPDCSRADEGESVALRLTRNGQAQAVGRIRIEGVVQFR
jgi:hypothetical protein